MTNDPIPASLPITKAAHLLGVHPNTLRAWADQGRVRCLRVNDRGDRRFLVEDLRAFLLEAGAGSDVMAPLAGDDRAPADLRPPGLLRAGESNGHGAGDWEAQIESIAKLGVRLNHLSTVHEIGLAICAELRQLIEYHNVRVYRVYGKDVVPVAWRGEGSLYTDEDGEQLRLKVGQGITGWVAEHGVAQYLPDAATDPRGSHVPGTEEDLPESLLVAPMVYEEATIGVIVLAKLGLHRFSQDDLRYLKIYASIAAQAMANADIAERLRAQEDMLDRQVHSQRELLRVTERILTSLDPTAIVAEIAESLAGLIPVDTLGIYLHDRAQRLLDPLLARGVGADDFMARPLPDRGWIAEEVLATGEARTIGRVGDDAEHEALVLAPLRGQEQVLGILYLRRHGDDVRFEAREFDLVRLFAAHASIALQNALAHRAVQLQAQTDALTGLRNHGTFRDDLTAAIRRGHEFALLMVDLDDFKTYNDRHGHEAGNALLRGIAEAVASACRKSDRVYRYGGDEFCLILARTGLEDAMDVADRVRKAIRSVRGSGRRAAGMRCSVGVATFPGDAEVPEELLLAADRALYAAKRAGRDRISCAADGVELAADVVPVHTPVDD